LNESSGKNVLVGTEICQCLSDKINEYLYSEFGKVNLTLHCSGDSFSIGKKGRNLMMLQASVMPLTTSCSAELISCS
jgi:hypothetical protein